MRSKFPRPETSVQAMCAELRWKDKVCEHFFQWHANLDLRGTTGCPTRHDSKEKELEYRL